MNDVLFRRDNCRLCGGRDLELVLQFEPTPIGADYVTADQLGTIQTCYPLDLFLCRECSYVGIIDVIDPVVIFGDSKETTSMSLGVVEHLRTYADKLIGTLSPKEKSLVIDIGSNDGTFLKFFQNRGLNVLGIDPSHYIAGKANESGILTIDGFFTEELAHMIESEHGAASIITANRVIANIDDLANMIEGVSHLLTPSGTFVFETGYVVDIVQNMLFDTIYHEHLGYDSVKAFKTLFPKFGMELIDVERVDIKGGSLRCTVKKEGDDRPIKPSVTEFIASEKVQGFGGATPYQALASKLESAKSSVLRLLNHLQSEGKTIAGYGASVGSTTQIYHLGLGDYLSFLLDDDPRNQNLFSPGHHIPVLASEAIYDRNPDYIVILAWRYFEPIIRKHQAFLDQGGHFIIPLPELRSI